MQLARGALCFAFARTPFPSSPSAPEYRPNLSSTQVLRGLAERSFISDIQIPNHCVLSRLVRADASRRETLKDLRGTLMVKCRITKLRQWRERNKLDAHHSRRILIFLHRRAVRMDY